MHPLIDLGRRFPPDSVPCRVALGCHYPEDLGALWDALLLEEDAIMLELETGQSYYIGTITYYYTGRVVFVSLTAVVLTEAARVYYTGRFAQAMRKGEFEEVEPYPRDWKVIVPVHAITDVCAWPHKLPDKVKP